jgi:hypothetical protein
MYDELPDYDWMPDLRFCVNVVPDGDWDEIPFDGDYSDYNGAVSDEELEGDGFYA